MFGTPVWLIVAAAVAVVSSVTLCGVALYMLDGPVVTLRVISLAAGGIGIAVLLAVAAAVAWIMTG